MDVLCCVTFHPLCELSDYTVVCAALSPTLTVDIPAIGHGVSQALFSPDHQCRSTEVMSQNCTNHGSGPIMDAMQAAQTLAWPNSHVYVPIKAIAGKARPVLAVGALIVRSDVLQALTLQSQSWGCKSAVCAAMRRDFNSSSLVAWPLGPSCGFSSTSACGPPQASAPESAPKHPSLPQSTRACPSREGVQRRWWLWAQEPALVGALPNTPRGRGRHMGREDAKAALPFACHSTMALLFCCGPGCLHDHSRLQNSSLLFLLAVSSQPTAILSPGLHSTPHVPVPSPAPIA